MVLFIPMCLELIPPITSINFKPYQKIVVFKYKLYTELLCLNLNKAWKSPFFFNWCINFLSMRWSCLDLIFLAKSKEVRKIYPYSQEILLIFCSIPSKKIGNPTSSLLISASAQTILTPAENYLLLHLHREWRSLAGSDAFSSCSLSNSVHTFHIFCSFADKPSIQTQLLLPVALLAVLAEEKSKTWRQSLLKFHF